MEKNNAGQSGLSLKQALSDYVLGGSCEFDYAVTLTSRCEVKNRQEFSREVAHFAWKLNDALYGNNWQRRAKKCPSARLAIVPVIEDGRGTKALHCHCAIAKPKDVVETEFRRAIRQCWEKTRLGWATMIDVTEIDDLPGWITYITKEMSATNIEALDVENLHIY